ncbi:MAG: hypothetical protein VYA80_06360 [Pseudomonadota bacterium]|nr:hypothetical protein [Pseudomonadota bacterium]
MTSSNLRIAFTFDFGSFAALKALLESHGIQVLDIAFAGHVTIAGADQGYYLEVIPEDKKRARQILQENSMEKYLLE